MSPNIENVIGTHIHSAVHKIFRSLCPQVHVLVGQMMCLTCSSRKIEGVDEETQQNRDGRESEEIKSLIPLLCKRKSIIDIVSGA